MALGLLILRLVVGLTMAAHGIAPGPASDPEKQWWNLPAKYKAAERIKGEMLRDYPGRNDAGDAARHAELSRRMTAEIDPMTASVAGWAHEAENLLPPLPPRVTRQLPEGLRAHIEDNWHAEGWPELRMDLHNNAVGVDAGLHGRPIDPRKLQTRP